MRTWSNSSQITQIPTVALVVVVVAVAPADDGGRGDIKGHPSPFRAAVAEAKARYCGE